MEIKDAKLFEGESDFPYTPLDSENTVTAVEIGGVSAAFWGKKTENFLPAALSIVPGVKRRVRSTPGKHTQSLLPSHPQQQLLLLLAEEAQSWWWGAEGLVSK